MDSETKACPECGSELQPGREKNLKVFSCAQSHGTAVSLVEAYGQFQHDEVDAIWDKARAAPRSFLPSPISGQPMAEVTFMVDDDPRAASLGSDARQITIGVDVENQFGWFPLKTFDLMPTDSVAPVGMVGLTELGTANDDAFFSSLTDDDFR